MLKKRQGLLPTAFVLIHNVYCTILRSFKAKQYTPECVKIDTRKSKKPAKNLALEAAYVSIQQRTDQPFGLQAARRNEFERNQPVGKESPDDSVDGDRKTARRSVHQSEGST